MPKLTMTNATVVVSAAGDEVRPTRQNMHMASGVKWSVLSSR